MNIIFKLLKSQSGQFLGGLFQGLNQSLQQNAELEERRARLKLEQQRIKIAEQEASQKQAEFQRQQALRQTLSDIAEQAFGPRQAQVPLTPAVTPQAEAFGTPQAPAGFGQGRTTPEQLSLGGPTQLDPGLALPAMTTTRTVQPSPQERLAKAALQAGDLASAIKIFPGLSTPKQGSVNDQIIRELATDPVTGLFDARKAMEIQKEMRTNPEGFESRVFNEMLKEHGGDVRKAGQETARIMGGARSDVASQTEMARIRVRGSQEALAIESKIQEAKEMGRFLDAGTQLAVTTLGDGIDVANRLMTDFTPQERAQFVGFLNFPVQRLKQIEKANPRFAKFQTLVARAKSAAFGEGGKQLTPFEASVVFGYVPTGVEFSAADFEAKLNETLQRGTFLLDRRLKAATTPAGRARETLGPQSVTGRTPTTPTAPTGGGTAILEPLQPTRR